MAVYRSTITRRYTAMTLSPESEPESGDLRSASDPEAPPTYPARDFLCLDCVVAGDCNPQSLLCLWRADRSQPPDEREVQLLLAVDRLSVTGDAVDVADVARLVSVRTSTAEARMQRAEEAGLVAYGDGPEGLQLTAEGCDLEAPWRGSARIFDGWEGLLLLPGWGAGSSVDAPHLAQDVERLVRGPLDLVLPPGLVELALIAQQASEAGTELAMKRNEPGIVVDGDGANERVRRCRRGLDQPYLRALFLHELPLRSA
jgi:hypothetical protein